MNYKAVWKPLPGSQSLSLSCPCNEILYEGTRGPGKTAAQLARFRRLVGLGYGSFWRGVIFDTEYKN
ncbi:terminase, partial [Escherichia coli]|nr:terminase [Escherichia coli]